MKLRQQNQEHSSIFSILGLIGIIILFTIVMVNGVMNDYKTMKCKNDSLNINKLHRIK